MQVASIVPSSKTLVRRVLNKIDFNLPRVIAEFGPGEGCHTREIVRQMHPESRLLLVELDPELARHLERQFADDPRISVFNTDAAELPNLLLDLSLEYCDYVVSGIPFSILEISKKRELLRCIHRCLAPAYHAAFVIYQVTNELVGHCRHFPRIESEYCLQNIPPMFVTKFYKTANGAPKAFGNGSNGHIIHRY
jgi:phosphatidylethanolamine/phosphatidyl-N-methylethanolamine N-methyltransferase